MPQASRRGKTKRGQKTLSNGRSAPSKKFIQFHEWMMTCPAWAELNVYDRAVLLELKRLYNGSNNGHLFLSCREAARRCGIGKNTAAKALRHLEDLGFIKRRAADPRRWSDLHADRWILTEHDYGSEPATKDFMRWRPAKSETRTAEGTDRTSSGTAGGAAKTNSEEASPIRDGHGRFRRADGLR